MGQTIAQRNRPIYKDGGNRCPPRKTTQNIEKPCQCEPVEPCAFTDRVNLYLVEVDPISENAGFRRGVWGHFRLRKVFRRSGWACVVGIDVLPGRRDANGAKVEASGATGKTGASPAVGRCFLARGTLSKRSACNPRAMHPQGTPNHNFSNLMEWGCIVCTFFACRADAAQDLCSCKDSLATEPEQGAHTSHPGNVSPGKSNFEDLVT